MIRSHGNRTMAVPQKPKHSGKPVTGVPYRIRRAVAADAPALVALERACFGDPWAESSFREALETPVDLRARGRRRRANRRLSYRQGCRGVGRSPEPRGRPGAATQRDRQRAAARGAARRWASAARRRFSSRCAPPTRRRSSCIVRRGSGRWACDPTTTGTRVRMRWCCGWGSPAWRRFGGPGGQLMNSRTDPGGTMGDVHRVARTLVPWRHP